ncbi:HAD family hydrolase [Fusibacter paucivorans]|uniref:D,D-heptose 1,7-bisphosphate phosphatase n=1 Tax=Fusibacter paucivorans TaxID=76009 RepID=A0ABS5PN72_9FIRM|nr:HAD family hydrolase [Fusibacter paucivorans]MBS7526610.1 HAD family hydrolase [Fusibacter paucivorans]
MTKAIFLDRDGIINEDDNYIYKPKDFRFMEGIFDFCHEAVKHEYLLIVITNQSGIARGYFTEQDLYILNSWMCARFEERDIHISKVYFCPYHPEKGIGRYKVDSNDRKPNPGMLFKAKEEFDIDLKNSIIIGDKDSDMEAGRRAGIGLLLLMPGKYSCTYDEDIIVVKTLNQAKTHLFG